MASISTRSWSDLPIDLLVSITKCLPLRSDLLSFRFVCSDWRSAVPRPKHPPCYMVSTEEIENQQISILKPHQKRIYIPLPFFSYKTRFLCASNGWLVFATGNDGYQLFDPVSHQKHWLPPLTSEKMIQKNEAQGYFGSTFTLYKAAVSVSSNGGVVAVAGIAEAYHQMGDYIGQKFCYFEFGKEKRWEILKKMCDDSMVGIRGSKEDAKRFYAIGVKCGLYVVEAGPLMRWRKFNLGLPKRILGGCHWETVGSGKMQPFMYGFGLRETNNGYLEVCLSCLIRECTMVWLSVKVTTSHLRIDSKYGNVYGDANCTDNISFMDVCDTTFVPRL